MGEHKWQAIQSAPYNTEVEVSLTRRRKPMRAILKSDASMDENERACDQWQATTDDYPKCWTDGGCWESNADMNVSDQPTAWRPL